MFNVVKEILYAHPAKLIFKFHISPTRCTLHWSTIWTIKGFDYGPFSPSFFRSLSKIIFTLDPPSKRTSFTPILPICTYITNMASSKSSILVVVTLQTSAIPYPFILAKEISNIFLSLGHIFKSLPNFTSIFKSIMVFVRLNFFSACRVEFIVGLSISYWLVSIGLFHWSSSFLLACREITSLSGLASLWRLTSIVEFIRVVSNRLVDVRSCLPSINKEISSNNWICYNSSTTSRWTTFSLSHFIFHP